MLKFLKDYQCIDWNKLLVLKYKECSLNEKELAVLLVIMNLKSHVKVITPSLLSQFMNYDNKDIDHVMVELMDKGFMSISTGQISIEPLYQRLLNSEVKEVKDKSLDLIETFENEFSRPLSPSEMEIIRHWCLDGFEEEMIVMALYEAVKNGVKNFKYIEAILNDWKENGVHYSNKLRVKEKKKEEVSHFDWWNNYE